MAKNRYTQEKDLALVVGVHNGETIDVSSFNGVFVQVTGDAAGAGTLAVQHSNDGQSWTTIGTAAISAGKADYNATGVYAQLIRSKVTLSAGPGIYNIYTMAKDQG